MKILILNASPKPTGTISQMLRFLEDEIRRNKAFSGTYSKQKTKNFKDCENIIKTKGFF